MSELAAFEALLGGGNGAALPLLAAAAQVPRYADADCDPRAVVDQVRAWAIRLEQRIAPDAAPVARLRLLNHFFFGELGFAGDRDDYDCVDNSYLHRVIERRRGIPITLSLLYIELGRAAGLRLHGVSFPRHFLVRLALHDGAAMLDVFGGGLALSSDELRARLRAALPGDAELAPHLRAAGDREILARLLRNLKAIHWQAGQWPAALAVCHRLVAVLPDSAPERRDRAQVYERLECPRAAAADLAASLSLQPAPGEAGEAEVRRRLRELQQAAARLN